MNVVAGCNTQRIPVGALQRQAPAFSSVRPQRARRQRARSNRSAVRVRSEQAEIRAEGDTTVQARENESAEEALQRRLKESARVEERVVQIYTADDFQKQLEEAGDQLLVLEVESTEVCQTGYDDVEHHWKEDKEAALVPCQRLKHVLQRTARDSPDVHFVTLEADGTEGQAACDTLGIEVLPTIQFWKNKQMLWEHRGVTQLDQDLSEGVLYYADHAAQGVRASDFITELHSRAEMDKFIKDQADNVLTVITVVLQNAAPCIHIFPAVLALAKNFTNYAHFARLIGDETEETAELLQELNVNEVPTFLFYRGGKPTGKHVGSSRADLIGQILQQQNAHGVRPPKTGSGQQTPRREVMKRKV